MSCSRPTIKYALSSLQKPKRILHWQQSMCPCGDETATLLPHDILKRVAPICSWETVPWGVGGELSANPVWNGPCSSSLVLQLLSHSAHTSTTNNSHLYSRWHNSNDLIPDINLQCNASNLALRKSKKKQKTPTLSLDFAASFAVPQSNKSMCCTYNGKQAI